MVDGADAQHITRHHFGGACSALCVGVQTARRYGRWWALSHCLQKAPCSGVICQIKPCKAAQLLPVEVISRRSRSTLQSLQLFALRAAQHAFASATNLKVLKQQLTRRVCHAVQTQTIDDNTSDSIDEAITWGSGQVECSSVAPSLTWLCAWMTCSARSRMSLQRPASCAQCTPKLAATVPGAEPVQPSDQMMPGGVALHTLKVNRMTA